MSDDHDDASSPWLLGGRYRMDGVLGTGGMSRVWHGYDERLDRRVAIKVMLPAPTAPVALSTAEARQYADDVERDRQRFLREIRTTARLEHPGIPAVYDTGIDSATDQLYLVMQLLAGSTLRELITEPSYAADPPPVAWAAAVAAQIAATLADVHRVDVIHRDIKPENVMLVSGGLVKVLDFGIAILKGAGALPRLTQLDRTVGTPPYMSPEQSIDQSVGPRSDTYSLGCLFHELLTGHRPYTEGSGRSYREQHLFAPIPSVRGLRPDVPSNVDELVSAMLAKRPEDRPDAHEVYETLLPLTTRPSDRRSAAVADAQDPTMPFRRPLAASSVQRASRPGQPLATPRPLTEAEADLLIGNAEELVEAGQPNRAIGMLEDGVARAAHDPILALQVRHALAGTLFYADEYTKAGPLFDSVGRQFAEELGDDTALVVECAYYAGYCYAEAGDSAKALDRLQFYAAHAAPSDPAQEEQYRAARYLIARMLATTGNTTDALAQFREVRRLYAEAYGQQSTHVMQLDRQIARIEGTR